MMQKIKVLSTLAILSMSIFVGCGVQLEQPSNEEYVHAEESSQNEEVVQPIDSVLKVAMKDPSTMHPLYSMDASVQQTLHLLFDTLVNIEDDGSITPNIAETWVYDPVDYSLDVQIRRDIQWHDGQSLQADDVVFSLETIRRATDTSYKQSVSNISYIQQIDNYNFTIYYKQPFSGAYQTLFFPVVPEHVYNVGLEQALELTPIGSGPYKYDNYISNQGMTFLANNSYFMGAPKIKTVDVMIVPDEESMLYAFEQGLIDVIYTDVMDWGKYAKNQSATVYEMSTQYYEFLGLNFKQSLFANERIREALIYGIDREELIEIYYLGHGSVTDTPISPQSYLYHEDIKVRAYEKEKAKSILAEEGYIINPETKIFEKDNQAFSFSILVNNDNVQRVRIAQAIQLMYQDIGIDMKIETVSEEEYLERVYNKQFEAVLGGWKLSYIPDLSFAFHSTQINSGDNFVGYSDSEMDQLLQQVFVSTPNDIVSQYEQLQEYMVAKNPYISLYFRNAAMIAKKQVSGDVEPNPLNIYANIELWEID